MGRKSSAQTMTAQQVSFTIHAWVCYMHPQIWSGFVLTAKVNIGSSKGVRNL